MLITTLLKDMEKTKRNAFILFAVAGVALAVGVAFSLVKDSDKEAEPPVENVYADLPEAEDAEIPKSKSQAYLRSEGGKSKNRGLLGRMSAGRGNTRPTAELLFWGRFQPKDGLCGGIAGTGRQTEAIPCSEQTQQSLQGNPSGEGGSSSETPRGGLGTCREDSGGTERLH